MTHARRMDAALATLLLDSMAVLMATQGAARCVQLLRTPMPEFFRHCQSLWERWLECLKTEGDVELPKVGDWKNAGARERIRQLMLLHWPAMGHQEPFTHTSEWSRPKVVWRVNELCSALSLECEGRALRHCVATYGWRCRKGELSIFSLRCRGGAEPEKPVLTIAVDRQKRTVVQIRGFRNGRPDWESAGIFQLWREKQGLKLAKGLCL
jgi:hypothetical protein